MRDGSGSSELPVEIQRPRGGGDLGETDTWIYNGQHPLLARSMQALREALLATSEDQSPILLRVWASFSERESRMPAVKGFKC